MTSLITQLFSFENVKTLATKSIDSINLLTTCGKIAIDKMAVYCREKDYYLGFIGVNKHDIPECNHTVILQGLECVGISTQTAGLLAVAVVAVGVICLGTTIYYANKRDENRRVQQQLVTFLPLIPRQPSRNITLAARPPRFCQKGSHIRRSH